MSTFYITDKEGNAIEAEDMLEFSNFIEKKENKIVKQDGGLPGTFVSTVFLGLDYRMGRDKGPPLLWETMIFVGDYGGEEQWRWSSREEALKGHEMAVEIAKSKYGLVLDD